MRIASLLPAAPEIVAALGRADDLVAVTDECDEPTGVRARARVVVGSALAAGPDPAGLDPADIDPADIDPADIDPARIDAAVRERAAAGLPMYTLDRDGLRAAAPDVVLTQDLCRVCALPRGTVDDALAALGLDADVVPVDPHSLDEVLDAVLAIGRAIGAADAADILVDDLRRRLALVAAAVADRPRPRMLALEWTDPPFLPGHWVPELVRRAGGEPVAGIDGGRSVATGWDRIAAQDIDVVLVAPCGFGLDDALAQAATVRAHLPDADLVAVDSASYVVRAGPRLVDGVEALAWALHPDAVPAPPPGRIARDVLTPGGGRPGRGRPGDPRD